MDPFERIKALAHRIDAANGLVRSKDIDEALDRAKSFVSDPNFQTFFVENLWCVLFRIKPLTPMQNDRIAMLISDIDHPDHQLYLNCLDVHRGVLNRLARLGLEDLSKIITEFEKAYHLSASVDPTTDNALDREYSRHVDEGLRLLTVGL